MKIDKNIPMPTDRATSNTQWSILLSTIKVGDSILFDSRKEVVNAKAALERKGGRGVSRQQKNGKYRLWRTK